MSDASAIDPENARVVYPVTAACAVVSVVDDTVKAIAPAAGLARRPPTQVNVRVCPADAEPPILMVSLSARLTAVDVVELVMATPVLAVHATDVASAA